MSEKLEKIRRGLESGDTIEEIKAIEFNENSTVTDMCYVIAALQTAAIMAETGAIEYPVVRELIFGLNFKNIDSARLACLTTFDIDTTDDTKKDKDAVCAKYLGGKECCVLHTIFCDQFESRLERVPNEKVHYLLHCMVPTPGNKILDPKVACAIVDRVYRSGKIPRSLLLASLAGSHRLLPEKTVPTGLMIIELK